MAIDFEFCVRARLRMCSGLDENRICAYGRALMVANDNNFYDVSFSIRRFDNLCWMETPAALIVAYPEPTNEIEVFIFRLFFNFRSCLWVSAKHRSIEGRRGEPKRTSFIFSFFSQTSQIKRY